MLTKDLKLYLKYKLAYYNGTPIVSDNVFDTLLNKIKNSNPNSEVLNKVGYKPDSGYLIKHNKPMLSLNKVYTIELLTKWANGHNTLCTYKLDGTAVSIIYTKKDGYILAKTRGDGIHGKNITDIVKYIELPIIYEDILVRGLVIISKKSFSLLAELCKKLNIEPPTSIRNAVAGLLNPKKKNNIDLAKFLQFISYDLVSLNNIKNEIEMFIKLHNYGFKIPVYTSRLYNNYEEFNLIVLMYKKDKLSKMLVLTDGLVFTINDRLIQLRMGLTSHHPKGKLAFKLQNETGVTTVLNILHNVGKNGKISFVADVEPILLSGAIITKVSLHNAEFIISNDIHIGSKIRIIRSGEVIPKFLSIEDNTNIIKYILPKVCPSCLHNLLWSDTNIDLLCNNKSCSGQSLRSIIHWCKTIGILGVSEGILSYLYEIKYINNYKDLYKLTIDQIKSLPGFGLTSATNIIDSIHSHKSILAYKFLCALNIQGIGINTSKDILNSFKSFEIFINNINIKGLLNIPGIGIKTANTIIENSKYIQELYSYCKQLNINIIDNNIQPKNKLSFCVTGTLSKGRNKIHEDILNSGYTVLTSVNRTLSYLVCNDVITASSKIKSALKYNIPIITEQQLYDILRRA